MNKIILHIIVLFSVGISYAQDNKAGTWEGEKDYLEYRKSDKYKGPEDWYGSYPADMGKEDYVTTNNGSSGNSSYNPGIQYSPQQIQKDRQSIARETHTRARVHTLKTASLTI